ncbi:MAG: restriction endonuclease subunit S [Acidobacteria bacterium]|nr:restriction endonuclease subunit S [Acidobacteriota bacterium]MBI3425118.1 restriction endonuclease subunit S [Acidobacteriota bacterium]
MTWKKVKLGDFLRRVKNLVEIENEAAYKLVTVRLYHKGVVLRKEVLGKELSSNAMHQVSAGEFTLSGIDARHGAFGIVPQELSGAVVSNDFWCLDLDENVIDKHFFLKLTSTAFFDDLCKKASDGTTNRVRLQADKFFNIEILLPSLEEQKQLFEQFQKVETGSKRLAAELDHQLEIVRRLRQAFLSEAMQGKLVAQDAANEPAAVLLQKIKAEKEKLIAEKKLKRGKLLPPINSDEVLFEIPDNWAWCRLGEITNFIDYRGKTPTKIEQGIKLITAKNVRFGRFSNEPEEFISEQDYRKHMTRGFPRSGDILFTTEAPLGNACLLNYEGSFALAQRIINIQPISFSSKFLLNAILSKVVQEQLRKKATGVTALGIKSSKLVEVLIALPPLAEQKRIVAKLETLLAFCDELEARIRQGKARAESLLQVALKEALQA